MSSRVLTLPGTPSQPRMTRDGRLVGWLVALTAHGLLLGGLLLVSPPTREHRIQLPPVRVRLVRRSPPPADPRPVAVQPPATEEPRAVVPRPTRPRQPDRRRPRPTAQPTAAQPAARPPAPAPTAAAPRFTVDMSATVPGAGVAVPTAPAANANKLGLPSWAGPTREAPGAAVAPPVPSRPARPLELTEVARAPRLVWQPSAATLRAAYPPRARQDGLEADVVLKILVGLSGRVTRVRMIRGAGNGFDEAATRLVREFRFEGGTNRRGQSVAVWIPWTYKFRLDG